MIWLNPWAWIGAAAIALPILIHLLGRGHARAYRFPTLRFLEASRLLPTRRTKVHDVLLLIVRCSVILIAAAALARPLILTRERKQALDAGLARAIVIDSSASMRRVTSSGAIALDSARRDARFAAAGAATSVIVESNDLPRAIASANEWLVRQGKRGELIVLSDFQRGVVDSADFRAVRKDFGIALRRIPIGPASGMETRATADGMVVVARATLSGDRTDADWSPRATFPSNGAIILLGGSGDRDAIRATEEAARTAAIPMPVDTGRRIAIVFANYSEAAKLRSTATATYAAWMVDLLARLRLDSIDITSSGVGEAGGRSRLLLFTALMPGSLGSARLVAAANGALSIAPPASELEPVTLSDATLASLQRPASEDVPSLSRRISANGPSDGRWLWLAVLALLGIETALRRSRNASASLAQGSP